MWDLVLLRPERRSEADRAVSIQLVVLATGSLGSGPRGHLINATLESVMLTVWKPSAHLAVSFFIYHFHSPAQLVRRFTLSDLLDKPWS